VRLKRVALRDDAADQAEALCLWCVNEPTGQHQVHRLGSADGAGEALRPARTREGAKRYLGMAEASVASGNHNIAHLDQLAAAAYGIAKSGALWRFSRPYIHAVIETSLPESGMEIFRAETGAPESAYLPKILIMVAPCDSGRRSCSAIGQLTPRKEAGQVSHLNLDYLLS